MKMMFELLAGTFDDGVKTYSAMGKKRMEQGPVIASERDLAELFGRGQFRKLEKSITPTAPSENKEVKAETVVSSGAVSEADGDAIVEEIPKAEKEKTVVALPALVAVHAGLGKWNVFENEEGKEPKRINRRTLTKKQAMEMVEKGL